MTRGIAAPALALALAASARAVAGEAGETVQPAGEKPPAATARPADGGGAVSPPAAQAPPATAAAKSSPSAERVARALTTQASWDVTVREFAASLSSQISAAVKAQGGEVPADVERRVRTGLDHAVAYEEVVRLQAQALAGRFGEDELRTIGRFYETGPGKRLVAEMPAVSRQVIETVQRKMSAAIPRIVQDVAPSLARAKPGSEAEGTAREPGAAREGPGGAQGRKPPAQTPPRR